MEMESRYALRGLFSPRIGHSMAAQRLQGSTLNDDDINEILADFERPHILISMTIWAI